ncbi:Transcription initiation factor TFIID subunit 9 [Binucleata daphniae]
MSNESAIPRDTKVISLILRSLGIEECEPKVILQILEFGYKYTTEVLQDAQIYAEYCDRKNIIAADVKLALQTKIGKHFVTPPPRQYMNEIASTVNSKPLIEYESDNMVRVPDAQKALFNLDYDVLSMNSKKTDNKNKEN